MLSRLFPENIARLSSRRPKTVVAAWVLALVLGLMAAATLLSGALTNDVNLTNQPESVRARELIEQRLGEQDETSEIVVFQSDSLTVDDPAYQTVVVSAIAALAALDPDEVSVTDHYYAGRDESLVSDDRRTTIAFVEVADEDGVPDVRDAVHAASEGSGVDALLTGVLTVNAEFNEIAEKDLQKGESIGLLAAIIILAIVVGAVVASFIPVILAVVSIVVAVGVTAVIGQSLDLTFFIVNIITMMGLAVGIDYSLFILSRYREERRNGYQKLEAIAKAGATATRAVVFSGLTVVVALIGLLIMPDTVFSSLALGAIVVVIVSVLSSLTLLPAVLSLLGDRVNAIRVPYVGRNIDRAPDAPGGFWDRVTRTVMGKPVISFVLGAGLLIAAATPVLDLETGVSGVDNAPAGTEARVGFVIVQDEFGFGQDAPAIIVIDGPPDSAAVTDGLARLDAALARDPDFGALEVESYPVENLTVARSRIAGDAVATGAINLIDRLRGDYIPAAFGPESDRVLVTGETAFINDWLGNVAAYTPFVFALVLGLSFVLLMLAFRSLADAGIPIDRGAAQGDRDEPAVGRRRLRPAGTGLPEGHRRRPAGLPAGRVDRGVPAALPVQHPFRSLHGLSRLPLEPHPGALRPDGRQRRGGRLRPPLHRTADHRRRPDHGLRLRRLRPRRPGVYAADGLRTGRGGVRRRNDRPVSARPRDHAPARRRQLVPARLDELAARRPGRARPIPRARLRRGGRDRRRLDRALPPARPVSAGRPVGREEITHRKSRTLPNAPARQRQGATNGYDTRIDHGSPRTWTSRHST